MQRTHKTLTLQKKEFEGLGLGVLPAQRWVRTRNYTSLTFFPSPVPAHRDKYGCRSWERRRVCSHQLSAPVGSRTWAALLGAPAVLTKGEIV